MRRSPCWNAPADFMEETGQPFEVALAVTRAGNLFTTHTAVAAGFDRFAPALIEQYLGGYAEQKLGIALHDLLALGRQNPDDASEAFNMAYLAIRGSGAVNGVSRLHGKVSRHLFEPLFPHWPEDEVPGRPRDQRCPHADLGLGAGRRTLDAGLRQGPLAGDDGTLEQDIRRVSDASLWQFRTDASKVAGRIRPRALVPATGRLRRLARGGRRRRSICSIPTP